MLPHTTTLYKDDSESGQVGLNIHHNAPELVSSLIQASCGEVFQGEPTWASVGMSGLSAAKLITCDPSSLSEL